MLHKLRKAMAVRNGLYKLDGVVELDESFFGAPKEGGCRGRGAAKQKVLVGLSLTKDGKPLHLRLQVLPCLDRAQSGAGNRRHGSVRAPRSRPTACAAT